MLKNIKTLLKDNILLIAISISICILCLSLIEMPKTSINISNIDKAYHGFAYFVLTITWLFTFYKKPEKKNLIAFICILFGIIIEVFQTTLTNYRTGDYIDVLANSLGVLFALILFNLFFKKKYFN